MPSDAPSPLQSGTGFKVLLSLACVVIIVAGLRAASEMLIPIILGLFLAVLSMPILNWLGRRGVPRALAVILTILFDVLILFGLAFVASGVIPEFQGKRLIYADLLKKRVSEFTEWADAQLMSLSNIANNVGENGEAIDVEQIWTFNEIFNRYWDSSLIIDFVGQTEVVGRLTSLMAQSFFVLVIMIFILAESGRYPGKLRQVFRAKGPDLRRFRNSSMEIQKYLGIKTAVSMVTGILAWLVCTIFGVDFPILWGMVAFGFNYIPAIGSLLAAIPPIILALILHDTMWPAVGVLFGYLSINVTLGNFLEPMVLGNRFGISTVVVILSVLFWGYVWGPVGMFLAVPLTMMVKVMLDNSNDFRWLSVLMGKGPSKPGVIRKLVKVAADEEAAKKESDDGEEIAPSNLV
ncbi:MAG: AI-2E family transporter [Verrucomicrobia bacterium]|nr:AI-2E family transporter [Verrucomicrobiota bacterium]